MKKKNIKLAVIGLGYVGLPLAVSFAKKRSVIAFDLNQQRIKELKLGYDQNLEIKKKELQNRKNIFFTSNIHDLKVANCFIISVPTPVDKNKKPDLKPLLLASKIVGKLIKKESLIIYESTVYPGCTEEECVPVLEKYSKLKLNKDFYCGYSPERINPGDKKHTISKIKKITSGSTLKIANLVNNLYKEIITAGTHKAASIKIAEAAKVIENIQRDLNIALINELSIFFNKININTKAVLDAAGSKWNFLPFKPGLVGGHCIGVDPYYLTYKAKSIAYKPKIILAGRKINDNMGSYVAKQFIKSLKEKSIKVKNSKILIMGLTFKENCPDIRNTGVLQIVKKLKRYNCKLDFYDPWADKTKVKEIFGSFPKLRLNKNTYDGIIIAVAHNKFKKIGLNKIKSFSKKENIIFDLKYLFPKNKVNFQL